MPKKEPGKEEGSDGLTPLDRSIILVRVQNPGWSYEQIGQQVGIDRRVVSNRLDLPEVKAEMERIAYEALSMLSAAQVKAMATMIELLDDADPNVRHKAAKEILKSINPDTMKGDIKTTSTVPLDDETVHAIREAVIAKKRDA